MGIIIYNGYRCKKHFDKDINEKIRLTGGFSFETWLLILENGQKIVFRTASDFETNGGRKIIIAETFERERFFYDCINKEIGHICPEVYVIDNTRKYYDKAFQISEYIEGIPLNVCFNSFDEEEKNRIYFKLGENNR